MGFPVQDRRQDQARQGLGPCHTVSSQEARNRAAEARKLILDGKDPLAVKAEAKAAAQIEAARTLTFEQACQQFLATEKFQKLKDKASWKSDPSLPFPDHWQLAAGADRLRDHASGAVAGDEADGRNRHTSARAVRAALCMGEGAQAFHWRESRQPGRAARCTASQAEGRPSQGAAL